MRLLRRPGAAEDTCFLELHKWHRCLNFKPVICQAFAGAEAAGHSLTGGQVTGQMVVDYLQRNKAEVKMTPEQEAAKGELL